MSKTPSQVTAIGLFVLVGTALLVAMLIAFGGGSWFRSTATYTMLFNSSVKGLSGGSPVMFRGVNIGQVTGIRLQSPEGPSEDFGVLPLPSNASKQSETTPFNFPVLVTVELDPEKLGFPRHSWWAFLTGKTIGHNRREELQVYLADMVVEQGLRAKLQTVSMLTGQLSIELSFDPMAVERDNPDDLHAMLQKDIFPTGLGFLDKVSSRLGEKNFRNQMESIQKLLAQLTDFIESGRSNQLIDDITVIAANLRTTTDTLNQRFPSLLDGTQNTIAEAQELVNHANRQLIPLTNHANLLMARMGLVGEAARLLLNTLNNLASKSEPQLETILAKVSTSLDEAQLTLEDTRASLKEARAVIAPTSPVRTQLEKTLDDCQTTLNSLRLLLENLNRNPQMLLMGE